MTNSNFNHNNASSSGGAIYFYGDKGNVINSTFCDNSAHDKYGGAIYFGADGNVDNSNFTNNFALGKAMLGGDGGALYFYSEATVTRSNFNNNDAYHNGGAIEFNYVSATVNDCTFTGNSAGSWGGAINFGSGCIGEVTNCNFADNNASTGGALFFYSSGNVANCNFTRNRALSSSYGGGAIYFEQYGSGEVTYSNFNNNTAEYCGGAVVFDGRSGYVAYCNFTNNSANVWGGALDLSESGEVSHCNFDNNNGGYGGAVVIVSGIVDDCNFTNNRATITGGAIRLSSGNITNSKFIKNAVISDILNEGGAIYIVSGNVENCDFTENFAPRGGAICFENIGAVDDCNFTDNYASSTGGAVYFEKPGNVSNSIFHNNSARSNNAGAVFFDSDGNVDNCNFIDNYASRYGGAITAYGVISVNNSNFTGNNASSGSAIYLYSTSPSSIKNSILLNNKADINFIVIYADDNQLEVSADLRGKDNLLNAIFSQYTDLDCDNVIYWGANGITNTGVSTVSPSIFEAGQNLTVTINNSGIIEEKVMVTNEEGKISFTLKETAGRYMITVCHMEDSYYTEVSVSKTITIDGWQTHLKLNVTGRLAVANVTTSGMGKLVGNVTFVVTNESGIVKQGTVNLTDDAIAEFSLEGLADGKYDIAASYNGASLFYPSFDETSFEISQNPFIKVEAHDVVVGGDVIVEVTLRDDAKGNVTATIGNITKMVPTQGGKISIPFAGLGEGTYEVNVTYGGNDIYDSKTVFLNVTVFTSIIAENITRAINSPYDFKAEFLGNDRKVLANSKVMFIINGTTYSVNTDDKGVAYLNESKLTVGTYNVTVINPVTGQNATYNVTIVTRLIENADVVMYYEDGSNYTVRAIGDDGKPVGERESVLITVNGVEYSCLTDENGYASLEIHLKPNTYSITAEYKNITVENEIFVNQTLKLVKNYITIYKGNELTLKATLEGANGKPIIGEEIVFKFRGFTFTAVTDSNGAATVVVGSEITSRIVKSLNPYSANYLNVTLKGNVKVIVPVLKLVKKTVSIKKGRNLVLKATLKWSNGKAIRGKKVVFTFKGKKYSAKTSSKGIAKVTIKGKVTKKLKRGSKYNYYARYSPSTVKGIVKVKR